MLTRLLRAAAGPPVRRPWLCEVEFFVVAFCCVMSFLSIATPAVEDRPGSLHGPVWIVAVLPLLVPPLALSRWWRPRWAPTIAVAGVAVCIGITLARNVVPGWYTMHMVALLGSFPVLLTVAVRRAHPVAAALTALAGIALLATYMSLRTDVPSLEGARLSNAVLGLDEVLQTVVATLVPITIGVLLRIADQRRHAAELARLRAAERLQVARELHDLIARHVTGMTMYAQAVASMPDVPERALGTLGSIETAGGDALAAMHRMVRTLRSDADPGLGSLDALPTSATDLAGAVQSAVGETDGVRVAIPPELRAAPVPADILGTVHRVVTEALTNVRRHAPDAREVAVELGLPRAGTVSVEVLNDVAGAGAARSDGGFGIAGLRERVDAIGGTVHVGPAGPGRWLLRAELPWAPAVVPDGSPVAG